MSVSPCACTHPHEACGYQLFLIIASSTLSPICWRVLLCGYTQPNKARISLWTWSHTHIYKQKNTLKPWRVKDIHIVNIMQCQQCQLDVREGAI